MRHEDAARIKIDAHLALCGREFPSLYFRSPGGVAVREMPLESGSDFGDYLPNVNSRPAVQQLFGNSNLKFRRGRTTATYNVWLTQPEAMSALKGECTYEATVPISCGFLSLLLQNRQITGSKL